MEVFLEWLSEFERAKNGEDNEQSQKFEEKLKILKNCP